MQHTSSNKNKQLYGTKRAPVYNVTGSSNQSKKCISLIRCCVSPLLLGTYRPNVRYTYYRLASSDTTQVHAT